MNPLDADEGSTVDASQGANSSLRSPEPEQPTDGVDVSVIVPVYNAMPYLRKMIGSLLEQDLNQQRYEILVIDDGSTDEGPAYLDDLAARHAQLSVVHQPNSGWPGLPRNRGLDMARGRYVFFADADDYMGREALRRMVEFADEHETDVLLPKMTGVGDRWIRNIYTETQVDADLELAFTVLGPLKLFRRSFLLEHGIRFPEQKVRLEDGMVNAEAYLKARRVSLLGGYDFYYVVNRDDGQNISSQAFDPAGYTWSIGEVSRLIKENDPDPQRADRIILDLYRRKCLKFYTPQRFLRMPQPRRQAFLRAHADYIATYIPQQLEDTLKEPFRSRSRLVRAQDEAGLVQLARGQLDQPLEAATLRAARWTRRGDLLLSIELRGARSGRGPKPLELRVTTRGEDQVTRLTPSAPRVVLEQDGQPTVSVVEVTVGGELFGGSGRSILDVSLHVPDSRERARVAAPLVSVLPPARGDVRPYSTVQHNLSIELGEGRASRWVRRSTRVARRALGRARALRTRLR